ncbi:MAG: hypothetical protein COU27_01865 [Candidatus Levybacteria bacterium CG10_big_fil_rev_8_21_14_0_10_36_7]|jgi:hypothetical protein|nr:MAG: hypothetical protein COU27_01865 [Candidatus Levybacteria bacterium CG10_big_fil_rev_8_21_14_0_10_36_7]
MKKILLLSSILLTPALAFADIWGEGFEGCGGWGGGMMMSGFYGLPSIIWSIVGVLAIVWLWNQISKKK